MNRMLMGAMLGILATVALACGAGGPDPTGSDDVMLDAEPGPSVADHGHVSTTYPAFLPSVPQLVKQAGPVLTSPEITPITFDSDDASARATIELFVHQLGGSTYWSRVMGEYGIGAAKGLAPLHIAAPAPATVDDDDVRSSLLAMISTQHLTPNPNSVYAIFYPAATTVTFKSSRGCHDFGGYHESVNLPSGQRVAYVVVPRCAVFNELTGMDMVTALASHEFAETATDPEPDGNPAYQVIDRDHFVWGVFDGVETGDLCTSSVDPTFTSPSFPFVVQRIWSNAAARLGKAPCQPSAATPYFNTAVMMRDRITMHGLTGEDVQTLGIRAAVGETKVVELDLFSDAPTSGPWSVSTVDITGSLTMKLDRKSGQNGEKLYLTLTLNRMDPHLGAVPFQIVSTLGGTDQRWYGVVGQ